MMAGLPCLILAGRGQGACRWGKRVKMTVGVTTTVYPSTGSGQAVTRRINPAGIDISLAYDQENRLITVSGNRTASYAYDGDGVLVKAVDDTNNITTLIVGPHYEVRNTTVRKYYYAGSVRVAERNDGVLYFLLSDHLGSTATTTDASGTRVTELRYKPYGDMRYNPGSQITTYRFTGQRWDPGTGLYFYGARWYDPISGRFIQADSIVPQPGNPQALNRYSYVLGNPLRYTDPTGMFTEDEIMKYYGVKTWDEVVALFEEGGQYAGQWGWLEVLRNAHLNDSVAFSGADRPGHEIFRGRFTEDDNGNLMIADNRGTMYDAGTVFHSYPHYLMTLYRDSLPGATIHVENNYLGSWKADQKYLHLKSVDWDLALNPFMWGELVEFTGATAAAGLTTALLISAGASVCSTGIGCLSWQVVVLERQQLFCWPGQR